MESSQDPNLKLLVPADEHQLDLYTVPVHSSWFSWDDIHETEKFHLREFFDGSSITRTPKIYKDYRDFIISKYREEPTRRLTFTEVRKSLVGDVSLLHKVFLFLDRWGLVNFGVPGVEDELVPEESRGRWKVRLEEGAPHGLRVVAVPNSLKPVTVPPPVADHGGEALENGFKLPPLTSYRDVYSEQRGMVCRNCKERCEFGHYECTKEGSFNICAKCFKNAKYGENKSADDFKFIDCVPETGSSGVIWTEAETLLLLESVLKHGDDWGLVAENVKTKSKADCISKLIQLPFGDLMLGAAQRKVRLWENDGNMSSIKHGQVASSECHLPENIKSEDESNDAKIERQQNGNAENEQHSDTENQQNGDAENQVAPLKRKHAELSSDSGTALMSKVALISSMVDPHVAAAAAGAAISALCDESQCEREIFDDNHDDNEDEELGSSPQNNYQERSLQIDGSVVEERPTEVESQGTSSGKNAIPLSFRMRAATATALGAAAAHAKLLADQEDREIEYLVAAIIETQMKKLQSKIKHLDDLELIMEKEHVMVEDLKESMITEQINVLRKTFSEGISRGKDQTSVKSQTGSVL